MLVRVYCLRAGGGEPEEANQEDQLEFLLGTDRMVQIILYN